MIPSAPDAFLNDSVALFFLVFEIEKDKAENEKTSHHGESTSVVGVGGDNEAFILSMGKWTDTDLLFSKQKRYVKLKPKCVKVIISYKI